MNTVQENPAQSKENPQSGKPVSHGRRQRSRDDSARRRAQSHTDASAAQQVVQQIQRHEQRVFPLAPTKVPALRVDWKKIATRDKATIERWWDENPDYNVGVSAEGLLIIDIDKRHGGDENFVTFRETHAMLDEDLPPTFSVKTWSGGRHLYYKLPDGLEIGNTVSKLARGVDTRGAGGYVAGPGSKIKDEAGVAHEYVAETNKKGDTLNIAEAPQWLIDLVRKPRDRRPNAGVRLSEETEEAVAEATRWIEENAPEAGEGDRNNTAFRVAARLFDIGVSNATALDLMLGWNDTKVSPPIELDELETTVNSAEKNRALPIGIYNPGVTATQLGFEPFSPEDMHPELAPGYVPPLDAFEPKPILRLDATLIKPREWVVGNMAVRGRVSVLIGPGGVAKSTWANQCGIALATGRDDVCGFPIPGKQRTWIWNQEDDEEEIDRRMIAALQHFGMTSDDLIDGGRPMLFRNSGVEKPLIVAKEIDGTIIVNREVLAKMHSSILEHDIRLMIIDPLVEIHRLNELDNGDMAVVFGQLRDIAQRTYCAVLVLAHSRKPPNGDSESHLGQLDALRGASAQGNVIRKAETLFTPSVKDGKRFLFPEDRLNYARMDDAKNNIGRKRIDPIWFHRIGVRIANGEDVGVLQPVEITPRVVVGEDRSAIVGKALTDMKKIGEWVPLKEIIPHIPAVQRGMFADKNDLRALKKEFQNDETLFEGSKLLQKRGPSDNAGFRYMLQPLAETPATSPTPLV